MSNKSSRSQSSSASLKADDFRLINGLPKTAKAKLHAAGILTFDQLAAMSPHEIVAALGDKDSATAELVIREDWIGQARNLAESRKAAAASGADSKTTLHAAASDDRLTSFVLELKLDKDNTVSQARVMHMESEQKDAEEKWAGWNEMRLLNFIAHRAKFAIPKTEPKKVESVESKEEIAVSFTTTSVNERLIQLQAKAAKAEKFGTSSQIPEPPAPAVIVTVKTENVPQTPAANLSEMNRLEVFAGSEISSGATLSSEPYSVKVLLDPAKIITPNASELAYTITVYAKSLVAGPEEKHHKVVGQALGVITPKDDFVFDLEGARLEKGAYRLRAVASFNSMTAGEETHLHKNILAFAEGGVLQVF